MALKFHPDKVESPDEQSKEMFQRVLTAYKILSDPVRREVYDRTGEVSDKDPAAVDQFVDAYRYYRAKFPEVREQHIDSFGQKYRFSEEEERDLVHYFEDNCGDVTRILEGIILSRNSDVTRFLGFFDRMLESEEHAQRLGVHRKTFERTRTKIRKLSRREAKQASKIKKDRLTSLRQAILLKNRSRRADLLSSFEGAFTEEGSAREEAVLKDKTKGTNRGKRASPGLTKTGPTRIKRKKVQTESPVN